MKIYYQKTMQKRFRRLWFNLLRNGIVFLQFEVRYAHDPGVGLINYIVFQSHWF